MKDRLRTTRNAWRMANLKKKTALREQQSREERKEEEILFLNIFRWTNLEKYSREFFRICRTQLRTIPVHGRED